MRTAIARQGNVRQLRPIELQDRGQSRVSPLELGLIEQPTRPRSEYTAGIRRLAIEAADAGQLGPAADLTRAAMTEDGYARGVLGTLTEGLWGLPMTFLGDPAQVEALSDTPRGLGQWSEMFPQPEAIKLMSWGVNLGVGLGQMRRQWSEPGDHVISLDEAADGTYRVRRPVRPIGKHATRVLRTWDPKYLRHQWWDDTWWLDTADGEIRIRANDGEWLFYMPYGSVKPWEYGAWKALTLAFVLARDAMFDQSRHAEVLAPVRVGKVPQGTTERQRLTYLRQIREMQRLHAFVLPPGLEYTIVESTGKINDIYKQIIDRSERQYCLIYTGNETTTKGTPGFSQGDVQERIQKSKLQSFSGSLSRCLRDGGLVEWSVENYGTADAPLALFDCDPPEDKLANAKTVAAAGESIKAMTEGLATVGLRPTVASVTAYAQKFGFAVEALPAQAPTEEKAPLLSQGDTAKALRADEVRALAGFAPFGDERGDMVLSALNAPPGGGPPGFAAPEPAPGLTPPAATVAESIDAPSDNAAAALAAKMTLHRVQRCEHERPNRCLLCGIERTRDFDPEAVPGAGHTWHVAWRPIGGALPVVEPPAATIAAVVESTPPVTAAPPSELDAALADLTRALAAVDALGPEAAELAAGYNPDQDRADDGKFGSGSGSAKGGKGKAPAKAKAPKKDSYGTGKAAAQARAGSKAAEGITAGAQAGSNTHEAASKAHSEAAAHHAAAAKASKKPEYKAAHAAAAQAHERVASAHAAEHAKASEPAHEAPKPAPVAPKVEAPAPAHAPTPEPAQVETPESATPEEVKASVTAKVAALPHDDEWMATDPSEMRSAVDSVKVHIESKLVDMPAHEVDAVNGFTNGHDYEMRALERGATKDDLMLSRMNKGESLKDAREHVEKSASLLPGFHAAQERLAVSQPPPPSLMRGMAASDRTLNELLTKDTFTNSGMSSSSSLDPRIASGFAEQNIGKPDFRGDKCEHSVIFKIDKARTAPVMHSALNPEYGDHEKEQILRRGASYRVTGRSVDRDGFVIIDMTEDD